jgi:5-oxopent-3-ene-1,2,5-tricarboxylate decarboxylase / 2-hydroxyhepta-2,4-diene-1,7-dioate isomerase
MQAGDGRGGGGMKRARIACNGAVFEAVVEADGEILTLPDGRRVAAAEVVWLPPVRPRTIVALGLNYADHAAELAFKAPEEPLVFLKGPNSLVGHRALTRRPVDANQMHPECELAVVIGRTARKVSRAQAYDVVGGYTVANDYAIREYLENYYRPNLRVKNRDGCTPIGPWVVDRDDIDDPMSLALRTTVNGREVQAGSTAGMVFDIPFLIEYLTSFMTLYPGDLILTGTPHGVAFVNPGDVVATEIEGVGRLVNTLVDDRTYFRHPAEEPRP